MTEPTYNDTDLVYVHPQLKKVIGPVEYDKNGIPTKKVIIEEEAPAKPNDAKNEVNGRPMRPRRKMTRYYPWCSYKTAKKVYAVEGKFIEEASNHPFESIVEIALQKPYWNQDELKKA